MHLYDNIDSMCKYILFDLDGTLTDPGLGITNAVMHALQKFNIEVPDRSALYKFIGPPLKDSFMDFYGMTEEQALQAIVYYREQFAVTGLFENEVYPGIPELLTLLHDEGYKLLVATSKPDEFTLRILKHFDLYDHFDFVAAATMDENKRCRKADVIRYALDSMGVKDLSRAVMIGDRHHDVEGAHECGLKCIGVTYGYGDRAEHQACGADLIVDTVEELHEAIRTSL